jgi:hypothetical protein
MENLHSIFVSSQRESQHGLNSHIGQDCNHSLKQTFENPIQLNYWNQIHLCKTPATKKFFYQNLLIELKIAAYAAHHKPLFSNCAIRDFTHDEMRRRNNIYAWVFEDPGIAKHQTRLHTVLSYQS